MNKTFSSILLLLIPGLAFAHGEDILAPILSQFGIFLILLIGVCFWTASIKKKLFLIVGFILGVVLSWILMIPFDYLEFLNHFFALTLMNVGVPIITTVITYRLITKHKS
jgi:hypothetical protein